MPKTKQQISITISPPSLKYLDYISSQMVGSPARSTVVDMLLTGEIRLESFSPPEHIRQEIQEELDRRKRKYQR